MGGNIKYAARAFESFGERNRITHVGCERFCAFARKALQSPRVAP
jgi:hypothetical protein